MDKESPYFFGSRRFIPSSESLRNGLYPNPVESIWQSLNRVNQLF